MKEQRKRGVLWDLLVSGDSGQGGGGGGIEVIPLNATDNGTYTAPSGKAYSPVTVSIPSASGVSF